MLRTYPPNSVVHAIMLMLFFAPTYYMIRAHERVIGIQRDTILVTILQALWIVMLFCGGLVVFGISFLWMLTGELLFAVTRMESPFNYYLRSINN